jgi:hypothetical protein
MPTAHSIVLSPPDFCRKTASRVLACVALWAFLALHMSMVWHGPEHALNESSRLTEAAALLQEATVKVPTADSAAASQNIATLADPSLEDLVSALSAAVASNTVTAEDVVSPLSATVLSHVEQVSSASELCLKCLEDVANTVGLTSQIVQLSASRNNVLQPRSQPVCLFATPVELANQRGPPTSLS